jgi:nucleoid-associated protein YgaU
MTDRAARPPVLLGSGLATALLLLTAPTPAASLRTLRGAGTAADPAAPLLALLALLAWLLVGWLLLTVAVTAGSHLPGLPGRALAAVSRRLAPATARRAVEVALGLTVSVGVLGAAPAAAAGAEGRAAPAQAAAAQPAPDLDWAAQVAAAPTHVVVQPGDSLWALAERDLAARAEPTSDAAVARAWPRWWAANRDVVGADPDLLQPGTRLAPPPRDGSTPASS